MDSKTLKELITEAGFKTHSYSSKRMHEKSCVGFDARQDLESIAARLFESCGKDRVEHFQTIVNAIVNVRNDSVGSGFIYYFPDFDWAD